MKPLCLGALLYLPHWLLRLSGCTPCKPVLHLLLALRLFGLPPAFLLCVSLSRKSLSYPYLFLLDSKHYFLHPCLSHLPLSLAHACDVCVCVRVHTHVYGGQRLTSVVFLKRLHAFPSQTGCHYVALFSLKLSLLTRLAWNSQNSACLGLKLFTTTPSFPPYFFNTGSSADSGRLAGQPSLFPPASAFPGF